MNSNYRNVIVNFVSLALLQVGNYIVPLVLTPYLIIKIGVKEFGVLSFATAIIMFFRAIISYGFDLSGTKAIAEVSDDLKEVGKIFQEIIYAKILLSLFCFALLVSLTLLIPQFHEVKSLLFALFILAFADVFFPIWLYQGVQRMKAITILKLSSRFIFVGLTMLLVNSSDDTLYIPLIEGSVALISSLVSFSWAIKKYNIEFHVPNYRRVISTLRVSWHIFLSKFSVLFYTRFNVVLLGLLSSPIMVGYYAVAEKIYMAIREMLNPLIQAVFPYLSRLRLNNAEEYNKKIKQFFFVFLIVLVASSLLLYLSKSYILMMLMKEISQYMQDILAIFSLCLLFSVGSVLSTVLIIENRSAVLSRITFFTVLLNLIIVYPLVIKYDAVGLAICFLIVQIAHFIMQLYVNRIIFFR